MLKRKTPKRTPAKRKRNPELYNLVFSDRAIEKLTPKQAIQHIQLVSEYPQPRDSFWSNSENQFSGMDEKELLEYIHSFSDRFEYMHYNK